MGCRLSRICSKSRKDLNEGKLSQYLYKGLLAYALFQLLPTMDVAPEMLLNVSILYFWYERDQALEALYDFAATSLNTSLPTYRYSMSELATISAMEAPWHSLHLLQGVLGHVCNDLFFMRQPLSFKNDFMMDAVSIVTNGLVRMWWDEFARSCFQVVGKKEYSESYNGSVARERAVEQNKLWFYEENGSLDTYELYIRSKALVVIARARMLCEQVGQNVASFQEMELYFMSKI